MKSTIKKLSCFLLALVMVMSIATTAFAKTAKTPVILVHGLGANPVYENVGTDSQAEIQNLGLGDIASTIFQNKAVVNEVVKMLDSQRKPNRKKLINGLAKVVTKDNVINCTKNGNVKKGQGVINYWTTPLSKHKSYWQNADVAESAIARQLCKTYGAKNVYCFNYDWRQDVCLTAKQLNQYIKLIKKQTGAKKVSVIGCSLGGAVLSAYIDAYAKQKDLKTAVFVNPAIGGVDVARAYALDLKISKKSVIAYLKCMETAFNGGELQSLFRAIGVVGDVRVGYLANNLSKFVNNKTTVKQIYMQVLKPWIGNIPSLWECIPYDSFNAATNKLSKMGFLDKKSGVYKKIKKYHGVQGRFNKNIKKLKKSGVQVAIFASYGTMGIPITSKVNNQTDALIDTKYASAGATVAKYGKKLKAKGKYVSGDKVINAKTCALPDNTWFLNGIQHMRFYYGSDATKLVANIACGKVKANVKAVKKKYKKGQFLKEVNRKLVNVK
ncbi:MAG: hypothetical protein IJ872_07845 [Eubacterium sp.]|nr:hypothetical protein [Eubacterium sp.]MBR2279110.1 hypothetical protein [Eubacterium sp.]